MKRVHYAWVMSAVGFVVLITAAGFRSTPGVLIVPLQGQFGWSRATSGLLYASHAFMSSSGSSSSSDASSSRQSAKRIASVIRLTSVSL